MIGFDVPGVPATKGSYRAIVAGRTQKGKPKAVAINDSARCKPWQDAVGWAARAAMRSTAPMTGPVSLDVVFRFERPKTTKLATPRLDVDKLLRALLDGLTGILYVDDKQVAQVHARKEWGSPGATVTALELPEGLVP